MCKFAFVGHWGHQGLEGNFPHPLDRGRSVQGHQPPTRSESAGGADRSPEGDPPRRRRQARKAATRAGDLHLVVNMQLSQRKAANIPDTQTKVERNLQWSSRIYNGT